MSLLTDEEVKEIRLSVPAVCTHADLIRHTEKFIEAKFEQGKRDALLHAAKVVELYDDATVLRSDYMIDASDCAEILIALAAAPKQEK